MLISLVNGHRTATISLQDRGLNYGDGVFETILVKDGEAKLIELHLRRLRDACKKLAIAVDWQLLQQEIADALKHPSITISERFVLKLTLTREAGQRGYYGKPGAEAIRIVQLSNYAANIENQSGIVARVCKTRLSENRELAGMKHLCRLEQVMARSEWQNTEIAEGIMLDASSRLIEATQSNLFIVKNNQLLTPDLSRCGVAGVMRHYLLTKVFPSLKYECRKTDLSMHDLLNADEVFVCNSLIGIWPVKKIACVSKSVGSVTQALQAQLESDGVV